LTTPRVAGACALAALSLATTACGSPGEADRTAAQILADTRVALATVHTFHMHGDFQQKEGRTTVDVDVVVPGAVHFAFTQAQLSGEIVAAGTRVYVKGSRSFWISSGGTAQAADRLQNRWVSLPASTQLTALLDVADPNKVADCLVGDFGGKLAKQGTTSVAGKNVVTLSADGSAPGTAPGRLDVASDGPPLPVRHERTGLAKAGGTSTCRGGGLSANTQDTMSGTVDFSNFNGAITVSPPKDAVEESTLLR
jgi:hypothetical protein